MMKVLYVLLSLTAISTSSPSAVNGNFGGAVVKTGYLGFGNGGSTGDGILSFLSSLGRGSGGYATKNIQLHSFQPPEVISEKVIDVDAPPSPHHAPAKKTVIERTVIPQYVEKTVRVPTYVEKTIRVPTYVEKTIKVPAAPTIVEKEISHEDIPVPKESVKVVEHHTVSTAHQPSNIGFHKVVSVGAGSSIAGSGGGGYAGGLSYNTGGRGTGLFDNIFNIPIQTLGAVNGLLNSLAKGITGGVSVSAGKGYSY